jgi:hypothetical protein
MRRGRQLSLGGGETLVAIDTSGKWWIGSSPQDIEEYLRAYSEDSYLATVFHLARCQCGSEVFSLEADDDEGVARHTCVTCSSAHYICDSGEYWKEACPERFKCVECHGTSCNVGVGFALYEDSPSAIRWLYVGERCANCGVLGCMAGWKVGLDDALHLLDDV